MMSRIRLEVFPNDDPVNPDDVVIISKTELEDTRLIAFDKGYAAGWDDAVGAQSDDAARLKSEVARSVQAMAFGFQEARAHLLKSLAPLIAAMVGKLLPDVARASLAPMVLDQLMPMAEVLTDTPVTILLHPRARENIEALLLGAPGLPVTLVEDRNLGEGQVYLKSPTVEILIDLDRATTDITAAIRGFFELTEEDRHYG
jgi:flagellar biosynthesis/type III secretory pathway protein FliH